MTRIACLCPTYKRPQLLPNAVACFLQQAYPSADCRLFILDDAGQYHSALAERCELHSTQDRAGNLSVKYNRLAAWARLSWQPDVYAVWEDDDIYLPGHLAAIAAAVSAGVEFCEPRQAWSTYGLPAGQARREGAAGRFHGGWAYTAELFARIGGYDEAQELKFDQDLGTRLRRAAPAAMPAGEPTYVYRWPRVPWHISMRGDSGFARLWQHLGQLPAPFVGAVVPQLDAETSALQAWLCEEAAA